MCAASTQSGLEEEGGHQEKSQHWNQLPLVALDPSQVLEGQGPAPAPRAQRRPEQRGGQDRRGIALGDEDSESGWVWAITAPFWPCFCPLHGGSYCCEPKSGNGPKS